MSKKSMAIMKKSPEKNSPAIAIAERQIEIARLENFIILAAVLSGVR